MRMLSTCPCPLAFNCLTWAALSQPQSCFGCSTHDDVSSRWLRGATAPCFSSLDFFVLYWRPIHPGQLEPTTLPLRRLAPVSCSEGLSPTLSLPFSLALSCSLSPVAPLCSFPTELYPLSLSFSLSLSPSRPKKGGSGRSVHLYSPRGSNHPLQDRRGVVYPLGHDDWVSAPCVPIFFSCVSLPVMRIFFHMGVCSAACRGTAQRPRVPGPPASRAFFGTAARGPLGLPATHACNLQFCSPRRAPLCVPLPLNSGGSPPTGTGATCLHFWVATGPACSPELETSGSS